MAYYGKPSDACYTCRKKRGKCDRRKPGCGQCARKRIPCPGYQDRTTVIFRDQTTSTAQKAKARSDKKLKQASPGTGASSRPDLVRVRTDEPVRLPLPSHSGDVRVRRPLSPVATTAITNTYITATTSHECTLFRSTAPTSLSQRCHRVINWSIPFRITLNEYLYSPHLAQEQLLSIFCTAISSSGPVLMFSRQIPSHTHWICQLSSSFCSNLLDNAVRAVSLVHLSHVYQLASLEQESRHFYCISLRLLSDALSDEIRRSSTETLGATILLSFYELFASDSSQSWIRHAGGASTLMRIRGPSKHLSGLGRDIYLAYRSAIYVEALLRVEPCFLSEPEWAEMAKQIHEDLRYSDLVGAKRIELFDTAEEFYMEIILIPRVCYDASRFFQRQPNLTADEFRAYRISIIDRCRGHRAKLQSINLRFRAAIQRLEVDDVTTFQTPDPVFPMQYSYISESIAMVYLAHLSTTILLNRIVNDFESMVALNQKDSHLAENREIAREICRTASFMLASSVFGRFCLAWALQLCLVALEPGEERAWVERKLSEIGNTHTAIATDVSDHEPQSPVKELAVVDPC